jgi:uncharacterized membrane protein YgcG
MFKAIINFFTGKSKKEAAEKAERERKILEDKELAIARRRAAQVVANSSPSMPPRNSQAIDRSRRQKTPVEVHDYRGYQNTDNTSLTMMAAMVALDDTPSRNYSHSNSYSSSSYDSSSSSSSSDSSSSSSCSGGGCD